MNRSKLVAMALVAVVAGWTLTAGCNNGKRTVRTPRASSAERSQSLLSTVTGQLDDLPEQSIIELSPPTVVLDAKKSTDGQDVMAEIATLGNAPNNPIPNALVVPADNGRFKSLVRSGDLIKWYGNLRSEIEEEFRSSKKKLSNIQIYVFFTTLSEADQRTIAAQRARGGDDELVKMLALPPERRQEVLQSMETEINNQSGSGDIVSAEAYELTVDQVIDSKTLVFDISKFTTEELISMPKERLFRMEVLRFRDTRFRDLVTDLFRYTDYGVPLLGWEPSPDQMATEQIVERLNQWLRQTSAKVEWSATPLLETLPQSLRDHERLALLASTEALDRNAFSLPTEKERAIQAQGYEGRLMQEASWARDISRWLTLGEMQQQTQVDLVFDWTVRQLQLDEQDDKTLPLRPWQCLAYAHATVEGRAWVFAQLCRQLDVPVVVLRPAGDEGPLWCGALVEGKLYLYDPELGLALQNAEGATATLAEVKADSALAAEFNEEGAPYLPEGTTLEELTAEIVAGPFALSRRAALLEERMTSSDALLVYVDAAELSTQLEQIAGVAKTSLWAHPYQVLAEQLDPKKSVRVNLAIEFEPYVHKPRLWKARLLHFRGHEGETIDTGRGNLKTEVNDHRSAGQLYIHSQVRPTDAAIAKVEAKDARRVWGTAKENATYWLGLLSYDRGDYRVATDWLSQASEVERWQTGANYSLARSYEALGELDKAVELLESSTGPQARGNRLRAKRLQAQ
ncbi:tetratricopeptide repeat protein [Aeoliella mucimassa]|nr:CDC27 family protein [Aeoliella mucimassa]